MQYRARMDAERIRKEEEAKLRKQLGPKKAKEEAERRMQVGWGGGFQVWFGQKPAEKAECVLQKLRLPPPPSLK